MRLHSNPIFEQTGKNYKTLTVGHSRKADILALPMVLEALECGKAWTIQEVLILLGFPGLIQNNHLPLLSHN